MRSPCPPSIGHRAHLLAARGLVRGGDTLQLSLWISVPPNPPHSHTHPPLLIPIGASRRWAPRRAQGGTGGGTGGVTAQPLGLPLPVLCKIGQRCAGRWGLALGLTPSVPCPHVPRAPMRCVGWGVHGVCPPILT